MKIMGIWLQLLYPLMEAWIFLSFPLLSLCNADDSWLRFSGPRRVHRGYRTLSHSLVTSVSSRSLITCISACLASDVPCGYVNYQQRSGTCELLVSGSEHNMAENPGWSTVKFIKQTQNTALPSTTDAGCPDSFIPFGEKCYYVQGIDQKTILDAAVDCDDLSAELLSIETPEEQAFINQLIMDNKYNINLWTSGQGLGSNAYQWSSTGLVMYWSDWSEGFPGGYYGQDSCVYIDGYRLTWKTDSCGVAVNRFICEYPKTERNDR